MFYVKNYFKSDYKHIFFILSLLCCCQSKNKYNITGWSQKLNPGPMFYNFLHT